MTLEVTESQRWLLVKALSIFTEDENMLKFVNEFDKMDVDKFADDLNKLVLILATKKFRRKAQNEGNST